MIKLKKPSRFMG